MFIWFNKAWADYLYWQEYDKKQLKRINQILKDIQRSPFEGIGTPEPLKGQLYWNRRIDDFKRIVYRIEGEDSRIAQSKWHYEDYSPSIPVFVKTVVSKMAIQVAHASVITSTCFSKFMCINYVP